MFEIERDGDGVVHLRGRLDASSCPNAQAALDAADDLAVVNFSGLDYISSAGLGVLLKTQKRMMQQGDGLTLVGLSHHIRDIFQFSGFDQIFKIE